MDDLVTVRRSDLVALVGAAATTVFDIRESEIAQWEVSEMEFDWAASFSEDEGRLEAALEPFAEFIPSNA